MYNTVSDCVDFAHGGNHAVLSRGKRVYNQLDAGSVIRNLHVYLVNIALVIGLLEIAALDADTVALTFGEKRFIGHID